MRNEVVRYSHRQALAVCLVGSALGPALLGLGCQSPEAVPEHLYSRSPDHQILDTEPVRGKLRELVFTVDGTSVECTFCHDSFAGDMQQQALENTHANIDFNHGLNLRCLNCHNENNPDTFVAYDGSEIPADEPVRLCSKCHGPHYRDWKIGIHGRANGHWSSKFGERTKLVCTQCHNPHKPHFQPLAPDPPTPLTRFQRKYTMEIQIPMGTGRPGVATATPPEYGEDGHGEDQDGNE